MLLLVEIIVLRVALLFFSINTFYTPNNWLEMTQIIQSFNETGCIYRINTAFKSTSTQRKTYHTTLCTLNRIQIRFNEYTLYEPVPGNFALQNYKNFLMNFICPHPTFIGRKKCFLIT